MNTGRSKTGRRSLGPTKQAFFWALVEHAYEYGAIQPNRTIKLAFVDDGKNIRSSCFGVLLVMIRKVLCTFEKTRPLLKRRMQLSI